MAKKPTFLPSVQVEGFFFRERYALMEITNKIEKVGRGRNAIDQFGLGEKVLMLRRNLTLQEVADRINKLTPEGTPNIGVSQIQKYCEKHGVNAPQVGALAAARKQNFNSLAEAWEVRNRVVRHAKKLERIVDQMKDDEEKLSEIASISNAFLNACKCLQDLNKSISKIEKEHLGHEKVRKVLKTLLEVLDEFPEVKARFLEKMRESTAYETIKYI